MAENLVQRGAIWYARVQAPKTLVELRRQRGVTGQKDIWRSLRTKDRSVAKRLLPEALKQIYAAFDAEEASLLREGAGPRSLTKPTEHELQEAAWSFLQDELRLDELERVFLRLILQPARRSVMAEKIDPQTRSRMMSGIRGANTKPELTVRRYLHGVGLRFRLFARDLPGRPDIVLPRWRAVVFVHGCFWHGHRGCSYFRLPQTRTEWWRDKIEATMERDDAAIEALRGIEWRVAVVWECALRTRPQSSLVALEAFIKGSGKFCELVGQPATKEPGG